MLLYRIPSPPPPSPDGRVSFISRAREETPPTSFFHSLPFTISHSAAEQSCGIRWLGEGLQISFDDFRHSLKLHSKVTLFIFFRQENKFRVAFTTILAKYIFGIEKYLKSSIQEEKRPFHTSGSIHSQQSKTHQPEN